MPTSRLLLLCYANAFADALKCVDKFSDRHTPHGFELRDIIFSNKPVGIVLVALLYKPAVEFSGLEDSTVLSFGSEEIEF